MNDPKRQYIVAFIDILGFKEAVNKDFNSSLNLLLELKEKLSTAEHLNSNSNGYIHIQPAVSVLSDSIIISYETTPGKNPSGAKIIGLLSKNIAFLAKYFLEKEFLIRGGIAHGKTFYHKNDVICGEAYQKAYELETNAIYPRVVIDKETIKKFKLKNGYGACEYLLDNDGICILNYVYIDKKKQVSFSRYHTDILRIEINIGVDFEEKVKKRIKSYKKTITRNKNMPRNDAKIFKKWEYFEDVFNDAEQKFLGS